MPVTLRLVQSDDDREMLTALAERIGLDSAIDPYEGPGDSLYWFVEVAGSVVGVTGVHTINWPSRRCRGSLWIAPEHRRNGYGREALNARNRLLFDTYNMNRVEWAVATENADMMSLAADLAPKREGIVRQAVFYKGKYHDYALYAILREDYEWPSPRP